MATSEGLVDWSNAAHQRQTYPYFLIDSAQHEGSYKWLQKWNIPYLSLFEGQREESLVEIAPLLIPLDGLDPTTLERLANWATDLGLKSPCFSWMESSLPADQLSAHLRNFHNVGVSDGQKMMLRWYDTRILPVWLACLEDKQLEQFTGSIFQLNFLNRFGDEVAAFASEEPSAPSTPLPLGKPVVTLDDRQLGMLVDAGDLDTLLTHLRRVITDETNRLSPRVLYEFVGKYQQRAVEAGIADIDRQSQYVLLALYTSGAGVEHPLCRELMADPPKELDEFFEQMQALPAGAWESGPPLWPINS